MLPFARPLVQKKLSTLSKAGLSGDDFKAADTTEFKVGYACMFTSTGETLSALLWLKEARGKVTFLVNVQDESVILFATSVRSCLAWHVSW